MVDPINSANVSRLRPADAASPRPSDGPARSQGGAAATTPVPAADTVALSDGVAVAIERLSQLEPPLDAARVARAKAAILSGAYPLDSQRIAESFFRDVGSLGD